MRRFKARSEVNFITILKKELELNSMMIRIRQ